MDKTNIYRVGEILWKIDSLKDRHAEPLCPIHRSVLRYESDYDTELYCYACKKYYRLEFGVLEASELVIEQIKALSRRNCKVVDIDGILTPVSKHNRVSNDGYFCTAQIRKSRNGHQLVVYAGKKGMPGKKCQIFVTPEDRKLSFDQTDLNPADVFVKLTAEFRDGTKHTIEGIDS